MRRGPGEGRLRHARRIVGAAALAVVAGACGNAKPAATSRPQNSVNPSAARTTTEPTTTITTATPQATTTTAPPPPTTTTPPTTTAAQPPWSATAAAVTAADVPYTWHQGCPVSPSQLSMLTMPYWGFDGEAHTGHMVVNSSVVPAVETVFRTLYAERFPIYEMVPEDAYQGNDNAAAAADDTSGFNCRQAVSSGPPSWSMHAYGEAIDVNDVQNPYIDGSTVIPPAGEAYANRAVYRPGMAVAGGQLVEAFASAGWQWGGRWSSTPDYQHFSTNGQ